MKKRGFLQFGIAVFILFLCIGLWFPTWTPGIKKDGSVSELKEVEINGTKLTVMIRGEDKSNPVIVFVHGGPGCSEIPYVRKYQDILEKDFTIVHYDQRGSGKSYHFFEDYSTVNTDVHVEDLLVLTEYITEKFNQEKVILAGHSFGTYIGIQAVAKAPENFTAYIGIGQVADPVQSEIDSLDYTLAQAKIHKENKDVRKLENLRAEIENGDELTPRSLVRKYGGAARLIHDNRDYYLGFLLNPEYNLLDVVRFQAGVYKTQDALLEEEREHPITENVRNLDIPVYFVMGKYDYMTSIKAAKRYFETLHAPYKEFVQFDESAHYPQFEEEEKFAKWIRGLEIGY
ncbi:alpha/beta hydrolase [Bacillus sp. BGMRC 2118]|nr:alpha/beta hydrolase [Bacillus sp. BGMRC 2118]